MSSEPPPPPGIEFRFAEEGDLEALIEVGDELFDYPIKPDRAVEFLKDPRHHLILAWEGDKIVGMASGFHYVHPDKDPQFFINEVSVIESHHNRRIGRTLVGKIWDNAKSIGCTEAWVGTEVSNHPAIKAYLAAGGKQDDEPFVLINFED